MPRWNERPSTLVPLILDNIKLFEPGAAKRRFENGRRAAQQKEQDVLSRLRALPDGERKADETKLAEAGRLVRANVIPEKEDILYLTFQELHDVVCTNRVDDQLVQQRKDAFRSYHALTPPRVLTSDGEAVVGVLDATRLIRDGQRIRVNATDGYVEILS